jgi:nitroreductase
VGEIGLFEAIYTQRAIRRLKPDPVSDELIDKLIEAATKAPSGGDRQPWAFVVVRDAKSRAKIGEWYLDAWNRTYGAIPVADRAKLPGRMSTMYSAAEHLALHIGEAPVLILVCANQLAPPGQAWVTPSHYGATLTTLHKMHDAEVKELLGIPDNVETVALIPIGYPKGKYGPTKRRPIDEVTHRERWDPSKA